MPPKSEGRMIRKGISRSRKMGGLSPEALALFCFLIAHYNAHGKMEAHPAAIKGNVCPWIDWLDIPKIESCLKEISKRTNVKWFQSNGGYFLHALHFDEHQEIRRRGRDYLPSFPGELQTFAGSDPVEFLREREVEREGEHEREVEIMREPGPVPRKATCHLARESDEAYGHRVEDFFTRFLAEDLSTWAEAYPGIDVHSEVLKAKLWLVSNPRNRKRNMNRFVTNWLARSQERGTRGKALDGSDCPYNPGTPEHLQYREAEKKWKDRE